MIFGAINKERLGLLGLAKGGDDKSVQGTARRWIRIGVAVDLSLVFFVALLPLSALLLVVQDSGGLADTVAKALATCRLSCRGGAFIRTDNLISMRASVTRAVVNALTFDHSSADGVNGVNEIDTSHIRRHWLARKKCDSHLARRHASSQIDSN